MTIDVWDSIGPILQWLKATQTKPFIIIIRESSDDNTEIQEPHIPDNDWLEEEKQKQRKKNSHKKIDYQQHKDNKEQQKQKNKPNDKETKEFLITRWIFPWCLWIPWSLSSLLFLKGSGLSRSSLYL